MGEKKFSGPSTKRQQVYKIRDMYKDNKYGLRRSNICIIDIKEIKEIVE